MCLAIPMRVIAVDASGLSATCELQDQQRQVGLVMLDETVNVGDYLMISLGQAMQKVSVEDAKQTWAYYEEILNFDPSV
jgi:hydrogenase expression/formation protein HypC